MITLKNIHHSYGNLEVLRGINLEINKGEIVSIIGKSGAGKTTLLQVMGTLLKPDKGEVIINDKNVYDLSENKLSDFRNKNIGFIFQFHQLLPEFTALENVMMPALLSKEKIKEKEIRQRAIELLTDLDLKDRLNHKPEQLSGGEKQRVAAARAIMMNPSIILADEPSGSLDSSNKTSLHNLLIRLREKYNQTIVIVTHDKELANISDIIIEIVDGKCS